MDCDNFWVIGETRAEYTTGLAKKKAARFTRETPFPHPTKRFIKGHWRLFSDASESQN